MSDVLARIVAETRKQLAEGGADLAALKRTARERALGRVPHRFASAISGTGLPRVIAEIKAASPSAGTIVEDPDVAQIALEYRNGGAAAISVVTEPAFFRGSMDWLATAREASGLPVLMKHFVVDESQLYSGIVNGADAILLLASLLDATTLKVFITVLHDYGSDALVEVHDEEELERAVEAGGRLIGVNNRNLHDFSVSLETSERLGAKIPWGKCRVAESGIRTRADVVRLREAGFNAFIVGESLLRKEDRAAAVRELLGGKP